MSATKKIQNPDYFLGREKKKKFCVERKGDEYIITESFKAPGNSDFKGRKNFSILVKVDLVCSPTQNYLEISSKELGARKVSNDPTLLDRGYPWDRVYDWTNSNGENLLEWLARLSSSRLVRPSERDRLGGKSPYKNAMQKQRRKSEEEIRSKAKNKRK